MLETQMMAVALDRDYGLDSNRLFSGGLGKKPWPSTPLEAQAVFCAGLPSGRLRRGFAGGPGKKTLHPPGPWDVERPPPMV